MTQQIVQLALVRLAFETRQEVSDIEARDLGEDVWYAHHKTKWATGRRITEHEKESIFATEILMNLGKRSTQIMYDKKPDGGLEINPLLVDTDKSLTQILKPAQLSEDIQDVLDPESVLKLSPYNLDMEINNIFEKIPEYMGEYWTKRCLALSVYRSKDRPKFQLENGLAILDSTLMTLGEASAAIRDL